MKSSTLTKPDAEGASEYFGAKTRYSTGPVEVSHLLEEMSTDFRLIDVRAKEDFEKAHIPGAFSLPEEEWNTYGTLSRDKVNILYCYTGTCHLAAKAGALFSQKGYPVMEMDGGFQDWTKNGFEVAP